MMSDFEMIMIVLTIFLIVFAAHYQSRVKTEPRIKFQSAAIHNKK